MPPPSSNPRRAALIYNPTAGGGALEPVHLSALSAQFELEVMEVGEDAPPDACARAALDKGHDLVIAAGGDGTLSAVAAMLAGTESVLGVLPRGTANSFATALEIPASIEAAIETLQSGEVVTVDTARANGEPMILHAALGFHAAVIGATSTEAKSRWGVLAYLATAVEKMAQADVFRVQIETDTLNFECRASNVMVAALASPRTVLAQGPSLLLPDDGTLDVTIVVAEGVADALATGLHLYTTAAQGKPATRDNVGYFACRRLKISAEPAQPRLIDGEEAGEGPLEVECVPGSLRVIVPRDAAWRDKQRQQHEHKLEGLPGLRVRE